MTNAGDVSAEYTSPMPNPLDADKVIAPNEDKESNPIQKSETIYDKIIRYYSEWAVLEQEGPHQLNQTSSFDAGSSDSAESSPGFVMPADYMTRNCIMNNYCYRY